MTDRPDPARRIHGTIARDLGIEIVGGKRKPGDILGGEIEASAALGVSRTAYREAIRILSAKGLVESRPKAGTRISPRRHWNMLDPDVTQTGVAVAHQSRDDRYHRRLLLRGEQVGVECSQWRFLSVVG